MTNTFRTELVYGMAPEEYYADPCATPSLTQSIAQELVHRSPAHAYAVHPRLGGSKSRKPTAAMDEGSIVDALLLGNGKSIFVVHADSFRTKAAQELRDAARAEGRVPILEADYEVLLVTVEALRVRLRAADVALDGCSQVAAFWVERSDYVVNGVNQLVQCRALFDHLDLARGIIYDLKKARTAHPKSLTKHVEGYGYDIQAAAYLDALCQCLPETAGRTRFEWLFVEAEEPYALTRAEPAGSMLALGRARWQHAVNTWAKCMHTGKWPCYEADGLVRVEASPWTLDQALVESDF